ncbi:hypothetical protein CFC21_068161 [Triticum aestivum]|uniref:Uncharacterized protein n=2 Tax=Triticum aestivum TaxID=4565 RepID=A0A3B6KQY1_WHEAT|nr:hypothetical protein CFC21_068161 [Triticum aestivum]
MRLSHCETYCASPLCYIPCLPKSKDAPPAADAVSAPPCPVEDKPPQVQKIEVVAPAAAAADKDEDGKDHKEHEDGEKTAAVPLPKSNLKKANCGDDGVCAPKGNVKWLDLLGKDLTEVKEFEPRMNYCLVTCMQLTRRMFCMLRF